MSTQLTTFQKCKWLQRIALTRVGEGLSYTSWDNEFVGENVRELLKPKIKEQLTDLQICNLTASQMEELCFLPADDAKTAYHIPIWIWEFLPRIVKTNKADESCVIDRTTCDNDHRAGMLWYTVVPATEEEKL